MVALHELVSYSNDLLQIDTFQDYCPNGLQVEGRGQVERLVAGVTASQALIDRAVELQANAVLVHHGYFWRGEDARVVGIKKQRLATLLQHDISVLAYHLPLDLHPQLGNNVQLAKQLSWSPEAPANDGGNSLLRTATLDEDWQGEQLAAHIAARLQRQPLHIAADRPIRRVAWCTGAAQSQLMAAAGLGVDAYLSGEASEQTVHEARESGIHFFAAGHHATERYGVKALALALAERFAIDCQFVDCDNPV